MSILVTDLRNEIKVAALAGDGSFEVEAFADVFARRLEDAEVVSDLTVEALRATGPRGKRLELLGFAEDSLEQSLVIFAGRYFGDDSTLTASQARDVIGRATGFIEASVSGWLKANLEMSSREWEYADYFSRLIGDGRLVKLRVILVTDGLMSDRLRSIDPGVVAGLRATYEIWDQRRVIEAALPEQGSEDIYVDFTEWIPGGLPCLLASGAVGGAETYLAVIPARVLADVFERYGSLLLESNVRSFLSARGYVNRGIQATLAQEPGLFLAYNNGLTTTAKEVELGESDGQATLLRLRKWQIVNGGQTTASLAHFLRNNKARSVEGVSIQMKLVTVNDADSSAVMQAVARYANSQNRVSAADLFSTHEFHVRLEQVSRRVKAPVQSGKQYRTAWFYERARGQWENDRASRGSSTNQARFDLEFPKSQRLTKTDWAKYDFCWGQRPDLVSRGAQSVFVEFASKVDELWVKNDGDFGDSYFRKGVGKGLLYAAVRNGVLKQEWYRAQPGYLANIVAYAIARFARQVGIQFGGADLDFELIWRRQRIGDTTLAELLKIAHLAQLHLTDAARPQSNVTQWAKQRACWDQFAELSIGLDPGLEYDLISASEVKAEANAGRQEREIDSGLEAVVRVMGVPRGVWVQLLASRGPVRMSPTERDLVQGFGVRVGRVPTDRQASVLIRLLVRASEVGVIGRGDF